MKIKRIIIELEDAIKKLNPKIFVLSKKGIDDKNLAYILGARDAYQAVLETIRRDMGKGEGETNGR